MMKQRSNLIFGLLVLSVLFPVQVFAARPETEKGRNQQAQVAALRSTDFCKNIDRAISALDLRVSEQEMKLSESRKEQNAIIEERRVTHDQEKEMSRGGWDTVKTEHFAKLLARATTTKQKVSVEKFQISLEHAVDIRRTAVDKAVSDFRSGITSVIEKRKSSVDRAITSWKTARDAAIAKAKQDCATGVGSTLARERLLNSMKMAQEKLHADLRAIEGRTNEVKLLGETRNREIQKAIDLFRSSVEEATKELRTAWKEA